jgi:hypothetical protein
MSISPNEIYPFPVGGDPTTVKVLCLTQQKVLSMVDPASGPQGPQGPQGAQGAQGAQGPQGPAGSAGGYTFVARTTNATIAAFTKNRLDANSIAITLPADGSLSDGDDVCIYADVARSGCTIVPNSGQTVEVGSGASSSSQALPSTRFAIWLAYTKATKAWFMTFISTM